MKINHYLDRDNKGRFKRKMSKIIRFILSLGLIVLVIIAIAFLSREIAPKIVYQEKEVILDNLTEKVNQLKGELIRDIFNIERGGHSEDDGLITFDPHPINKRVQVASIGNCQFKVATLQYYKQKLDGATLTGKEALLLALDDEKCKELMSKIIFTEEDGWRNWFNSGVKVNAKARLQVIKQLEN